MRAIAPRWQAQEASWGEAAVSFERLTTPAIWLCQQFSDAKIEDAPPLPEPLVRLLASSIATVLKAARVAGINDEFKLPWLFVRIPALWQSAAMPPETTFFLIPRMAGASLLQGASPTLRCASCVVESALDLSHCGGAEHYHLLVLGSCHMVTLLNVVTAVLQRCSGPTANRHYGHVTLGNISRYAAHLSCLIFDNAMRYCEGGPRVSAEMHSMLSCSLRNLLHSPLLDALVALQHVMVGSFPVQRHWETSRGASICLTHLPPTSMEADAMDSKVAMQVGHCWSHLGICDHVLICCTYNNLVIISLPGFP